MSDEQIARACVKIDLEKLKARLSSEAGRPLDEVELRLWLVKNGFVHHGDYFCDGHAIGLLKPDEILSQRRLRFIDGVTFYQ